MQIIIDIDQDTREVSKHFVIDSGDDFFQHFICGDPAILWLIDHLVEQAKYNVKIWRSGLK